MKRAKVVFCSLRRMWGESYDGNIRINLVTHKRSNPLRTFLHEQLHLMHPDWSEWRVRRVERSKWKRITQKEMFELGKRLFNRKFLGKEDD